MQSGYVEGLNGSHLFDSLYEEDSEGQKLSSMPGVDELLLVYKEKCTGICFQIFEYGLGEHEKRMEEVRMFWECVEDAKVENKDVGTTQINGFLDYKKKVLMSLHQGLDRIGGCYCVCYRR